MRCLPKLILDDHAGLCYNFGMFVRTKTTPKSPRRSVQVVENRRVGDQTKQKIIRYIGIALNEREEAEMKRLGELFIKEENERRQPSLLNLESPDLFTDSTIADERQAEQALPDEHLVNLTSCRNKETIIEGFADIFKPLFSQLGLASIFGTSKSQLAKTNILLAAVVARIAKPASKKHSSAWLQENLGINISEDRIYRLMDKLYDKIEKIQKIVGQKTLDLFQNKITVMLYDVTTLYFESFHEDELRKTGYSKDNKFKETQIVLGMATTKEGLPLWYEVFDGKTWEGKTFLETLNKFKEIANPDETVVVADRGMYARINFDELESQGYKYVVGAKLKNMAKAMKEEIIDLSAYTKTGNDQQKARIFKQGESRTLIAAWSQTRADKDCYDRQKLVDRVNKLIGEGKMIQADGLIKNLGTKKYLKKVGDGVSEYALDQARIDDASRWDGIYGVITNLPAIYNSGLDENSIKPDATSTQEILAYYAGLWRIEESFRISKHDLEFRPIYHFKEKRIRTHIAICYMAYAMVRRLEYQLELQQGIRFSVAVIRDALLAVQATIITDGSNGNIYRIPKEMPTVAKKIYTTMGIKRELVPTRVLSLPLLKNKLFFQS